VEEHFGLDSKECHGAHSVRSRCYNTGHEGAIPSSPPCPQNEAHRCQRRKLKEGKAKRTANNEWQKEIAETRSQKALKEKKRLGARTVEKVATESEERALKFVEQKRARDEKLADEIKKMAPGRAGAGS
jgi:hypothetical protein